MKMSGKSRKTIKELLDISIMGALVHVCSFMK